MSSQTPTIRVTLYEGGKPVREEVFTQKTIRIGKAGQAHLRLNDNNVSRQHCIIEVQDNGEVRLTDLESTNGTLVNGQKVGQAVLRPGDELQVGDTKMVLDFDLTAAKAGGDAFFQPPTAGEGSGKLGLETALLWGDKVLKAGYFPEGSIVTIGSTPGVDFFLPPDVVGGDRLEFVKADGREFLVDVTLPQIDGDFLVEGKIVRLPEMQRREKIEQGKYARIDLKTRARLKVGEFTFLLGLAYLPNKPKTSWWKKFNMRDHMFLVLSLILHLLFLIMVTLVPEEQLRSVRDPYEKRTQALKKIQVAMLERKVEEEKKVREEELKKLAEAQKPGTELTNRPVDEKPVSKIVTEDQVEKNKQIADTALTRVMGDQQDLLNQVLDAAGPGLGGGMMGIRVIGDRGLDAELAMGLDAFGGTLGGGGGGGFRGTGWGGGSEFGAADLRGIAGLSKSDAEGAAARLKFKGGGAPVVYSGTYSVTGELDKETVRRYIQTKMDQVRWCYQQEVQKNPELAGQVKIEWIILPTGKTTAVKVGQSSLGSGAVEGCLMSRISTWQFPSPRGGGTVRVSYPFIFRVTGGKGS